MVVRLDLVLTGKPTVKFSSDARRKLYIIIGDVGRRGNMQNLVNGWSGIPGIPDDQFGGPEVTSD